MTCEEIAAQIAELRSQLETIDESIADLNSTITFASLAIVAADTFVPPTYMYPPNPPFTVSSCNNRVTYLSTKMGVPGVPALRDKYIQMSGYLTTLAGYQATRDADQASINQQVLNWQNEGCVGDP